MWKSEKENKSAKGNTREEKTAKFTEDALQLLEILGGENQKIKNFLINSYKSLPVSLETKEEFYNYFITHSVFSAATAANPASSVITELLYEGKEKLNLPSPIDQYFLRSKAGRSIKARLNAVEEELPKIIEEYRRKGKVLIGNLGSGPGRDVINVFSAYYQNTPGIEAIHVDKDKLALERGKRMAKIKQVSHLIKFVEENFLKYKPEEKFDIVLLIGMLCPLDFHLCVMILKKIKRLFKKGGCLLASNVSKKMLE